MRSFKRHSSINLNCITFRSKNNNLCVNRMKLYMTSHCPACSDSFYCQSNAANYSCLGFDKSLPPVRFLEDRSISGKLRGLVCLLLNGMNACMFFNHNACFFETQYLRTCLSITHIFCFPLQNEKTEFC